MQVVTLTLVAQPNNVKIAVLRPGFSTIAILYFRFKDAKEIYKKTTKYTMDYNEFSHVASLTIHDPQPTDTGRYRLEALNKVGHADTQARVIINGKHL